jgi:hypothetical protein
MTNYISYVVMKIVQQTPKLLILQLRPMGLWIAGILLGSAGSFAFIILQNTTLTCSRNEPANCQLVTSRLLGLNSKRIIPVNTLRGATVEESGDDEGIYYRVIILTTGDKIPFTYYYSNSGFDDKQAIASHIEEFVKNPQITSLKEEQNDQSFFNFFWWCIILAVGCMLLMTLDVTCIFDKTLNTLTIKRQGLLGTKVIEHRLDEIKDVLIEEDDGTYRVTIVLVGELSLPLTSYYSSGSKSKQETVSCIKSFLTLNN